MSKQEEFTKAFELINSCSATIACGCEYNKIDAEYLLGACKNYIRKFYEYEEKSPE